MHINKQEGVLYMVLHSIIFGLPFYLWIIIMIVEIDVDQISYVGWAILMGFFAFGGSLRGEVREIYDLEGDLVEDIFSLVLVYPLAIAQLQDQIENGVLPADQVKHTMELGDMNGSYTPKNHVHSTGSPEYEMKVNDNYINPGTK